MVKRKIFLVSYYTGLTGCASVTNMAPVNLLPPWWALGRTRRLAKRLLYRVDRMNETIVEQRATIGEQWGRIDFYVGVIEQREWGEVIVGELGDVEDGGRVYDD